MKEYITNCAITQSNGQILNSYKSRSPYGPNVLQGKLCDGTRISGEHVFSAYSGSVVLLQKVSQYYTVIIQTTSSFCIMYSNLVELDNIELNQFVSQGQYIGQCRDSVFVEYLTRSKSPWPVRVGSQTWYKSDPESALSGEVSMTVKFNGPDVIELPDYPSGRDDVMDDSLMGELTDNTGGVM